ncbi:MAG: hydrogenase maturation protease [bacterium]|nr:hydrogenase maturation protease [bacterium]
MAAEEPQDCSSAPLRRPVLVLGLGNILLGDEGVGVRVVEAMADTALPANVEVFDGATSGLDLLDTLADRRKVIVIDALAGDGEPGTVERLTPADLAVPAARSVSLHDLGLLETLTAARQLGICPPEVVIFGVWPKEVRWSLELSPEISRLIPRLIELILREVGVEQDRLTA